MDLGDDEDDDEKVFELSHHFCSAGLLGGLDGVDLSVHVSLHISKI